MRFLEVVPTSTSTTSLSVVLWLNETVRLELAEVPDPDWLARVVAALSC